MTGVANLNRITLGLGAVIVVCMLLLVLWLFKGTDEPMPTPFGDEILVYRAQGPVYMRREHLRALLQHLSIELHRKTQRTPSHADDALLALRPLFPTFESGAFGKREKQRAILIKQALADVQEYENINNIELRRDFCETRYYGGPGDAEEKRRILNAVQTATELRKIEREDADESELTLLSSKLQTRLEQLIFALSTSPPLAPVRVVDLRSVEKLVDVDIGAASLAIRASPLMGGIGTESFGSAYPQVDSEDMVKLPGDASGVGAMPTVSRSCAAVMEHAPLERVGAAPGKARNRSTASTPPQEEEETGEGVNDHAGIVRRSREALSPVAASLYGRYL